MSAQDLFDLARQNMTDELALERMQRFVDVGRSGWADPILLAALERTLQLARERIDPTAGEGRDSDRDGGLDRLLAAVEAAFETVHGNGDLVYSEVSDEYGLTRESLLAFIEAARLSPDTRQEDGT